MVVFDLGFDKGWGLSLGRAPNGGVVSREKERGGGGEGEARYLYRLGQNPRHLKPSDRIRTLVDGGDRDTYGKAHVSESDGALESREKLRDVGCVIKSKKECRL